MSPFRPNSESLHFTAYRCVPTAVNSLTVVTAVVVTNTGLSKFPSEKVRDVTVDSWKVPSLTVTVRTRKSPLAFCIEWRRRISPNMLMVKYALALME